MLQKPMDVLEQFPVRKKRQQKQAFRASVQQYAKSLGYECKEEKGSFGSVNVVLGDSAKAKFLVTAHFLGLFRVSDSGCADHLAADFFE